MRNSAIEFLYETVQKYPDKICLIDGQRDLTFKDLFFISSKLADEIKRENKFNQPILVYVPKSNLAIISFAGILLSGNFYVPMDTESPLKRIHAIIEHIAPFRIITIRRLESKLMELGVENEKIIFIDEICNLSNSASIEKLIEQSRMITVKIIDLDPCYVMHTSGSTGIPKGVVIPHRGVIDYIEWAVSCMKVDENEIIGNQSPLYFDNSTLDIYLSWATGATLHLIPEELFMFPVQLINYLERHKITFIFFVPSVLSNISKLRLLTPGRLPSLKKIIFAGEVMPTKHLAYWQANLPGRLYANLYGPTEITVDCTYFVVDRIYQPHESLPIGSSRHNLDILILNEDGFPAKTNEPGELCVRGSSLALGYWNDKEKTDKVFIQNPQNERYFDRIYRTGDYVYKNDRSEIIFVGRKDSQIKHLGHRIELAEIELAAMSIDGVDNCCVIYDSKKQEIVLFYEGPSEISLRAIRQSLIQQLPNYMIPKKSHYLKKLPLTTNGKIDRGALIEQYL